ncbi:MAG: hypothetical protein E7641_05370 [Ruminococcaceae bacterium]|nr:hypothetical protein [Oscillospiraceae bacterium]
MYDISVPIIVTADTYDPSAVLNDLKLMGAKRVFLAIPFLTHDMTVMESYYKALSDNIGYFQAEGIEVGIWFWSFRLEDKEAKYTLMVTSEGKECHTTTAKYCPLDEGFLNFMEEHMKRLAAMHPDLIMFDDDLAFGFTSMVAPTCFCHLHRAKMGEFLGEATPAAEGLYEKMFSGGSNRYRSAFLYALGESLKSFAKRMRAAVDSVDPSIRVGQCGCITTYDYDGVDSFTLSKIFAGNTKPFLRLIGAPYWDHVRLHGNYLSDVIELERMQRAWYDGSDIEIFSEGDTYPRPRHRVPASHLEIFDAALRADGNMNGILKYAFCYSNRQSYERGYLNAHVRDLPDLEGIEAAFSSLSDSGVRIYETMRKIEDSDYSRDILNADLIRYQFFSRALRFLSHNSIPAAHRGQGCAGIVFGENARAMDLTALEKPLIIDEHAADILTQRGIDVGLVDLGQRFTPTAECYLRTGEQETVTDYRLKPPFASSATPAEGAEILSLWVAADGRRHPASYCYKNASGQSFLVLLMDAFSCADEIYKNYSRQKQIIDFLTENGVSLPAKCSGNPDLYLLCKENDDTLSIGLFNCFADSIDDFSLELDREYATADIHRAEGELFGKFLKIDHLSAFDWCYVTLKR